MNNNKRKGLFSIGIFLLIFFIQIIISAGILSGYFYYIAKNRITEIETNTREYSIILTEAFANTAELSYRRRHYSKLRILFQEKIRANLIDEAFFVLNNGKIIAHSNREIAKKLHGNIINDELAYNIDIILLPIKKKVWGTRFLDYNIIDKNVPFGRDVTKLLKKYIYKKVDVVGWLSTRAVIVKGRAVGSVNLIISKDRIYNFLKQHIDECKRLSIILAVASLIISTFLSVIVFLRYRGMRGEKTADYRIDLVDIRDENRETIYDDKQIDMSGDGVFDERELAKTVKIIKDAIPIIRKKG